MAKKQNTEPEKQEESTELIGDHSAKLEYSVKLKSSTGELCNIQGEAHFPLALYGDFIHEFPNKLDDYINSNITNMIKSLVIEHCETVVEEAQKEKETKKEIPQLEDTKEEQKEEEYQDLEVEE